MRHLKTIIVLVLLFGTTSISAQEAPKTFSNPILSGYHPDPSIVRVGEDYYMVNSTFEWFPGMPIHHSKDLVNWELIGYGLHRPDQVVLNEGLRDYMGIFAVTIRHHDDLFYLITTCVACEEDGNFYVTAENPAGPWSDPVWLKDAPGIDPSLMWDDDGKVYYVGHGNLKEEQEWPSQQGIWLQELDLEQEKLVGRREQLTHGHANNAIWSEGPHLYKIDGRYLLMIAEGGTGYWHSVTVFHSDSLWGPYIADMVNPVLSHRQFGSDYPIHSIGHADLVQTQNGDWWSVMLGQRKINGNSLLSRETFLTPVKFEGKTPIFNPGYGRVLAEQERPNLPWTPFEAKPIRDEFEGSELDLEWNMLRSPVEDWYDLKKGKLTLKTRPEVMTDFVNPSLLGRRVEHHNFTASTKLEFKSKKANEEAGMIFYRNTKHNIRFTLSAGRLSVTEILDGVEKKIFTTDYDDKSVVLKAEGLTDVVMLSYGTSEDSMTMIEIPVDLTIISDEVATGFNGPYVGIYTTSNGEKSKAKAVFDWFEYSGE